jgi:hypothetical protein
LLVVRATLGRQLRFTRASVPTRTSSRRWVEDEVWRGGQPCPTDVVVSMPDAIEREFLLWDAARCLPEYVVAYSHIRQVFPQAPHENSDGDKSGWRSTALGYDEQQLYDPPVKASRDGCGMPSFEPMPSLPLPDSALPPVHDGQAELKPWPVPRLSKDTRESTETRPAGQEKTTSAALVMDSTRLAELLDEMRRKHAAQTLPPPTQASRTTQSDTQAEEAFMYTSGMMPVGTSGLYRSNARMREKFPSGRTDGNAHFTDL